MKIVRNKYGYVFYLIVSLIVLFIFFGSAASQPLHPVTQEENQKPEFAERTLRYHPEGSDFVITNGKERYNRALYGTYDAFRIQAGDVPEFALYMPGTGGDIKLGIMTSDGNKWLNDFDTVTARYRPGMMLYNLKDKLMGNAIIHLQVIPMHGQDGVLLKISLVQSEKPMQLIFAYGGAGGIHPPRNGDIGADSPSVFYLTSDHARGNKFKIYQNYFDLSFKDKKEYLTLNGIMPPGAKLHIGGAGKLQSPKQTWLSTKDNVSPILVSEVELSNEHPLYFAIRRKDSMAGLTYKELPFLFATAEKYRKALAGRVQIHTPDSFINTVGGAMSIAANAIWQPPVFMHGAQAWRMPLNGWRGPYVADALGWHNRAKTYFTAYNKSQLTAPDSTMVSPDPKENLARQTEKIGVGIYNSGYIGRLPDGKIVPNHYDMNLVYIDAMMRHFLWTGDTAFMRLCWPVIKRHLAWERRNFDPDDDGLFDAYACIWASDALEYSGGDVAYSSAYNYFENKMAARIATILGYDPLPYLKEAEKIKQAMDSILWMPEKGWYAEYKDRLGLQLLHPDAGLWTIYHAIDKRVVNPFQAYQLLRYVDIHIPHIPIQCDGLKGYYMLSTTDWMPYTWSVNNVAMAEMAHTALAYWEGGKRGEAYTVFKSLILESMFLGTSPGNFEQLSYYDRYRGELYHDFADPIGICSRALVEGLFGIRPDALSDTLVIQPGWPSSWKYASFSTPDIKMDYHQKENKSDYILIPSFPKRMNLQCRITARKDKVTTILINNKPVTWHADTTAIGNPVVTFSAPYSNHYNISIKWSGGDIAKAKYDSIAVAEHPFTIAINHAKILDVNDPQHTLSHINKTENSLNGKVNHEKGEHTLFVKVKQNKLTWWIPVNFTIRTAYEIKRALIEDSTGILFRIQNNTDKAFNQRVTIQSGNFLQTKKIIILPHHCSFELKIPANQLLPGANRIKISANDKVLADTCLINRNLSFSLQNGIYVDRVNMAPYFNDKVTQIFKNKYLSPRPDVPTLQLPEQGIGNWAYPLVNPEINDAGLRTLAGTKGYFSLPNGISFATPGTKNTSNIVFTSQWNNYPDDVTIPLKGSSDHAYFLMAGSTNPMQSRMTNGEIIIHYTDGSADSLLLKNPGSWWPIEQDYSYDHYAFHCSVPVPWRVHLQTGLMTRYFNHYASIKGFTDLAIPGGAATVLDMPLDKHKTLQSLELKAVANDVVIGLMSVTLIRNED